MYRGFAPAELDGKGGGGPLCAKLLQRCNGLLERELVWSAIRVGKAGRTREIAAGCEIDIGE